MNPAQLNGCKIALLLIAESDDKSDDVAILSGSASWDRQDLWIDYGDPDHQFPVTEEILGEFRIVPREIRIIVREAQFFTSIAVGNTEENSEWSNLMLTGPKWPSEETSSAE